MKDTCLRHVEHILNLDFDEDFTALRVARLVTTAPLEAHAWRVAPVFARSTLRPDGLTDRHFRFKSALPLL